MSPGKSQGVGRFAEGTIELRGEHYVLDGTRTDGRRYGSMITEMIFEGEDYSPRTKNQLNRLDVSGLEFRLSEFRLDLRRP